MDSIRLIQFRFSPDTLEEKGNKGRSIFLCHLHKGRSEFLGEFTSSDFRHLHAGDYDFRAWILFFNFADDLVEVFLGFIRRNTTQPVIASEFEDKDVNR